MITRVALIIVAVLGLSALGIGLIGGAKWPALAGAVMLSGSVLTWYQASTLGGDPRPVPRWRITAFAGLVAAVLIVLAATALMTSDQALRITTGISFIVVAAIGAGFIIYGVRKAPPLG